MQNLAGGSDVGGNTKSPLNKSQSEWSSPIKNEQELFETVLMQRGLKLKIIWRDINM